MIFGNQAPKFQVSAVDVLLDYAVIEEDKPDDADLIHESDLDRIRNFIPRPRHHNFGALIHLHRYQDPEAKFNEIVAHLHAVTCKVWRHRDGQAFQNAASADADFVFESYDRFYLTTNSYPDGLRLKFKSLEPIDHSDFGDNWLFNRELTGGSSNAWYLDPTSGLMVVAADTVLARRLVAGKYKGTAIVIEGAVTNVFTNRLSHADWVKVSLTAVTTTETLDPAGGTNVDKLTATGANGIAQRATGVTSGNSVAHSYWLKSSVGSISCELRIVGSGAGSATKPITVTSTWREYFQVVDTSAYSGTLTAGLVVITNTEIIYSWHTPQFEDSAEFAATIVNPLATAAATRALEKFTILSANTKLTKLQGTISMWFKPYFDPTTHGTASVLLESGDSAGAAADSHIRFYYNGSTPDRLTLEVRGDNVNIARISYTAGASPGITQDTWHHIVATWDSTVSNGGHIYVDGVEIASGSTNSAFNVSETGDTIAIGSLIDATLQAFGEYDELFIDDRVWSAEEVLAVFNLPNGLPRTLI